MGTIIGYGSKHSHEFKLTLNETSTSIANNTSEVSFSFTIYKSSYSWSQWNSIKYNITINGTSYSGTIPAYSAGSTMTIRSGSQTIGHNSDGSKSINYSFSVNDGSGQSYTCGNASASGTLELTKIIRTPTFTANPSITSKGLNWIKFRYGATDIYSDIYYSLDNINWIHVTSDETTISNLTPEKTYTIYVQARNQADNNQKTTKTISATTYAIAKISTLNNFEHGSNPSISITNPASISTLSLVMKIGETQILSRTVTAGNNTITFSDTELDNLYKKYGSSSSLTATFALSGSGYTNNKTCTVTLKGNQKTARINVSNSWKRAKIWTNVSGIWKKAVIWTNVNGTWKRSI